MSTSIRTYLRQHHIGLLALFLILTTGTAQALSGSNTVFRDDIVDGEVRGPEVGGNTLGGVDIREDLLNASAFDLGLEDVDGVSGAELLGASGRIALSPPDDSTVTEDDVLVSAGGELAIDASCHDEVPNNDERNAFFIFRNPNPPVGTLIVHPDGEFVADGGVELFGDILSGGPDQASGSFSAITPNGDVLQGVFHTAINVQGQDCVFAIQAIG